MGDALRLRKGLYKTISDNIPTDVAQRIAKEIDSHTGNWSCIEKRYVKYAEKVNMMAWAKLNTPDTQ